MRTSFEIYWNLARYVANLPPDRLVVPVPHSDVDLQGTSHCWSPTKHLGHYDAEGVHVSALRQLEGRGKRCQPVVEEDNHNS